MTEFLQLVVVGLSTGSAFALVGMSLVLVYRTTGIVNFAQGVFAVIGGLFTFELSDDMPLVLAMLVSVVLAAFLSSILAVVAVGFRDRTTSLASTIITLGAAFLAQALLLGPQTLLFLALLVAGLLDLLLGRAPTRLGGVHSGLGVALVGLRGAADLDSDLSESAQCRDGEGAAPMGHGHRFDLLYWLQYVLPRVPKRK